MRLHPPTSSVSPNDCSADGDPDPAGAPRHGIVRHALAAPIDALLDRIVAALIARQPGFAARLRAISPLSLLIAPTDLPVGFLIQTAGAGLSLQVVLPGESAPAATRLVAPIRVLTALAECRIDADAIFFDRTLTIDGDIEPVLALRNAIESESIDVAASVLAALGPFAGPMRHACFAARHAMDIAGPLLAPARARLLEPVLERLDALERAVNRMTGGSPGGSAKGGG